MTSREVHDLLSNLSLERRLKLQGLIDQELAHRIVNNVEYNNELAVLVQRHLRGTNR